MKTKEKKRIVFLFITHEINNVILDRFRLLEKSVKKAGDVYMLVHKESHQTSNTIPSDIQSYIFSYESLGQLGYKAIAESIVPGSAHFPLLQFYRDYPSYQYYWSIEYDVVFTGNWKTFFNSFEHIDSDLLSSHIKTYNEDIWWNWWDTLCFRSELITKQEYIHSFNPIYRISNRGLHLINNLLVKGDSGHYEAFIPTALNYYNYKIADFGGNGTFVLDGYNEKFYVQKSIDSQNGTMRFRPIFFKNELVLPNKLYHPVKPN